MLIERDKRYAMLGNKCEKKQMWKKAADIHVFEGEFTKFWYIDLQIDNVSNISFLSDNKGHIHFLEAWIFDIQRRFFCVTHKPG